jgi:hypothetical protein
MVERISRKFLAVLFAAPLAACTSFNGVPDSVLDVRTVTAIPTGYYPAAALQTIKSERDKEAYRNGVMSVYMTAMDARYFAFRRDLSRNLRGGNFGLEIAALGIGGLGSVWSKAASEINAATTFINGSKGAFNKEVYLQQTLPAMGAMMDADRLRIASELLAKQSRSIVEYPLEAAFADLARYELSASVDRAIQQLTTEAGKRFEEQQARYATLAASCDPDESTGLLWGKINRSAYALAGRSDPDSSPTTWPGTAKPNDLAAAAKSFTGQSYAPASTQEEADRQVVAITDAIRGNCNVQQLTALAASAKLTLGD